MSATIESELARVERELLRLEAQRELLLALLGNSTTMRESESHTITGRRRPTALRPKNPRNTDAILAAARDNPGKSLADIARLAQTELNADLEGEPADDQLRKLYNVAYGLMRRGKLKKHGAGVAAA